MPTRTGRLMRPLFLLCTSVLVLTACASPASAPEPRRGGLPPIPARSGTLAIDVVYPGEGATLGVRDSTFVFGNVGTGGATLTINGAAVEVKPNGAFLAFLPVPQNGEYEVVATAGGQTERLTRNVRLPAASSAASPPAGLAIVAGSVQPRGALTATAGDPLTVRFRGTPGATARLVLPDNSVVRLTERPGQSGGASEYSVTFPARIPIVAADTSVGWPTLSGMPEPPRETNRRARVELIRGADTVLVPLAFSLGVLPEGAPRTAVAASRRRDRTVIGTAVPGSGTPYHWFFPNGTVLRITGEGQGQYRVALTDRLSVWVDPTEVQLLPVGTPAPTGSVGTVVATPSEDHIDLRLSTSDRLPFRVDGDERGLTVTVYAAETRTNVMLYGRTDPLIRRMEWEQPEDDVYRVHVELNEPLWGFRSFWDERGNLVVRIRRPPAIDPQNPLRGLYIAVDAGHPPGGAIGPTRLTEADANLTLAKRLVPMLREQGARVLETRPDTAAVGLGDRPLIAADSGVHLFVSVHNDAFADGVNPFENNGTHVFYNQPQSLELAREIQAELLGALGLRDLGISRRDLAVIRATWMPAVLTESTFMMIPEHEAALRNPEVQERIAAAHLRGIEGFLRARARPADASR